MPPPEDLLSAAAFDRLFGDQVLGLPEDFTHALHHVMEAEKSGAWPRVLARCGNAYGRRIAAAFDRTLAGLGQAALAEQPLEACVALIERHCATHGWGAVKLDLTNASTHGIVVARLEHSYFVELLHSASHFTDALLAGLLQGFFEQVSGQELTCIEVACAARGAPHCTFVIGAAEQLAPVAPLIGRATADAILAKLLG